MENNINTDKGITMAVVAERLIDDLIQAGLITPEIIAKLSELSKDEKQAYKKIAGRIAKGVPSWMTNFKPITKIDKIWYHPEDMLKYDYANGVANFERVTGKRLSVLKYCAGWQAKKLVKALKLWEYTPTGRYLFIKGYSKYDLATVISNLNYRWMHYNVKSPVDIIIAGYWGNNNTYYIERHLSDDIEKYLITGQVSQTLHLLLVRPDLAPRLDEIIDYAVMGGNLAVANIDNRLDDIVNRNLRLNWIDKEKFDYKGFPDVPGWTKPKNGIELKSAAKEFANCAGSYVDKVMNGHTVIIYKDQEMAEIEPKTGKIKQHFGPRNTPVDSTELRTILNKLFKNSL